MGDRLATVDMGRKVGTAVPLSVGGAGSPSNTMWPGSRTTFVPSDSLIHSTVWSQYANVTDRADNGPTALHMANRFYKRSTKNCWNCLTAPCAYAPPTGRYLLAYCRKTNASFVFRNEWKRRRKFVHDDERPKRELISSDVHRWLASTTGTCSISYNGFSFNKLNLFHAHTCTHAEAIGAEKQKLHTRTLSWRVARLVCRTNRIIKLRRRKQQKLRPITIFKEGSVSVLFCECSTLELRMVLLGRYTDMYVS